jgi:hypothetical protein
VIDPAPTFAPSCGRVVSSAFSPVFKLLATVVVALAAVWGWQMWGSGVLEMTLVNYEEIPIDL